MQAALIGGRRTARGLLRWAFLGIVGMLVILSGLGAGSLLILRQQMVTLANERLPTLQRITDARTALLTIERDDNQALLATTPTEVNAAVVVLQADFERVHSALNRVWIQPYDATEAAIMPELRNDFAVWFASQYRFVADLNQHSPAAQADAINLQQTTGQLQIQGDKALLRCAELQSLEASAVQQASAAADQLTTATIWLLLGLTLLICGGTLVLGWRVTRYIGNTHDDLLAANQRLSESVAEITKQHEEIEAQHRSLQTINQNLLLVEEQFAIELEQSERTQEVFSAVLETVRDGLVVYDADGQQVYRNEMTRRIFGLTVGDHGVSDVAQQITILTMEGEVLPPAVFPAVRVLQGEAPDPPTMYRLLRADGSLRIVEIEAQPLLRTHDGRQGVLGVVRDITTAYRDAQQGEILRNLAHACASAADEQAIAEAACQVLIDGLHIPNCCIVAWDRERPGYARSLSLHFGSQIGSDRIAAIRQATDTTPVSADAPLISLRVLATGDAHFNVLPLPMPLGEERQEVVLPLHRMAYVPIRIAQQTMAVLLTGYDDQEEGVWEAADQDLLQAVADELGLALHRAQLYEDARRLAFTDPLTGLKNHRALQQVLQQELASAAPQGTPMSVLMLDVDHFRRFNEQYGHDVGDRALRTVALAITGAIRTQDCAARYGGEEFTVILPGVDREQAWEIGERVRQAIAASRVPVREVEGGVALTASLGCATFPLNASAPASLLKAADIALYAAKHHGRNRVVGYDPALLHTPGMTEEANHAQGIALPVHADLEAVQALIMAIDLRDGYTAAHSERVSCMAAAIATQLELPPEDIERVRMGGLVHDVGKIAVPDAILSKPAPLSAEEWHIMRAHAVQGEAILSNVEALRPLLPLVRWHHERLDGSGYPDGLRGDAIPLLVRILTVADIMEAYTAVRPYHAGRTTQEGLRHLQNEVLAGKLDGAVVAALAATLSDVDETLVPPLPKVA